MSAKERGEIRSFFKGHPAYVPFWFQILDAAGFDPLRAQVMEQELTGRWWHYHEIAQSERAKAERQMRRRNG